MKCGVMTLRKKKNDHDQVNQNQNGNQNQKVSDSLAHTRLTQWGGAREKKGRIYQPHPLLNFSIGTQPLLDFLRLTITLQLWGWGGAREEKGRIYQPHPLLNFIIGTQLLLDFLRLTITRQLWVVRWG